MLVVPRQRFATPEKFEAFIAGASQGAQVAAMESKAFHVDVSLAAMPRTALFMVEIANIRSVRPADGRLWSVAMPIRGGFSAAVGGASRYRDFDESEFHLLHQDRDFGLKARKPNQVLVANILSSDLQRKATKLAGSAVGELTEIISVASPEGGALKRFAHHFWTELQRPGGLSDCPVALAEMEDCLVSLIAFAASAPKTVSETRASLAAMRRAEDYLVQHLMKPVTRSDLAAAAGVSIRTVSRGFRERHGISPMAWLKERRLEAAQRDLRAAQPDEVTVTEVALRYGFDNLGRFAVDYRRRFGETPSQTLRS